MKMGIMGAHGTGKTTLAYEMAENLDDTGIRTGIVTGVARSCPWPINKDTTEEAQRWIYHRHILMELEAVGNYEAVFCDRTTLDSLVYSQVAGLKDLVEELLPAALNWLATYDEVFWMRPREGWLVDDGRRDVDVDFQRDVDSVFYDWITISEISVTEVSPDRE